MLLLTEQRQFMLQVLYILFHKHVRMYVHASKNNGQIFGLNWTKLSGFTTGTLVIDLAKINFSATIPYWGKSISILILKTLTIDQFS